MALPLHEIFIESQKNFQLVIIRPFPQPRPAPPVNAVLMQIRPGESTYYKQLTFVLIYWIVTATESLKPNPLTSSFLSLLTLAGQAWQVELQQSSLIMWNKSICLEIVGRLQTAGDALILLLWCATSPPLWIQESESAEPQPKMVAECCYLLEMYVSKCDSSKFKSTSAVAARWTNAFIIMVQLKLPTLTDVITGLFTIKLSTRDVNAQKCQKGDSLITRNNFNWSHQKLKTWYDATQNHQFFMIYVMFVWSKVKARAANCSHIDSTELFS